MKPHNLFLVHIGNQTGIFNLNWRLTEISAHQTRLNFSHDWETKSVKRTGSKVLGNLEICCNTEKKKKKGVVNISITTTTVLTFDKSVVIFSSDPLTNQTNSLEAKGSSHVNKTLWLGCKQCSLHLKNKLRRHSRWPSGSEKRVATANSYVIFTHVRVRSLVLKNWLIILSNSVQWSEFDLKPAPRFSHHFLTLQLQKGTKTEFLLIILIKYQADENNANHRLGDYLLILYQICPTNIKRIGRC